MFKYILKEKFVDSPTIYVYKKIKKLFVKWREFVHYINFTHSYHKKLKI